MSEYACRFLFIAATKDEVLKKSPILATQYSDGIVHVNFRFVDKT